MASWKKGVLSLFSLTVLAWAAPAWSDKPPPPSCDVCQTKNCAWDTISFAIAATADGAVITVCPGNYTEDIDFRGKAITVRSRSGPDVTMIGTRGGAITASTASSTS